MQWFTHGETTERTGLKNISERRFLKVETLKATSTTIRSLVDLFPRKPHSSQDRPSKIRDVERNHNVAQSLRQDTLRHELYQPPQQEGRREQQIF